MSHEIKAIHLEGGNLLDDLRLDIEASHLRLDAQRPVRRRQRRNRLPATIGLMTTAWLQWRRQMEYVVTTGLRRRWFDDFLDYWRNVLNGRPITIFDFLHLLYDYRKRFAERTALTWDSAQQHVANWQHPYNLYSTFHNVRKVSLNPIPLPRFWLKLPKRAHVLEYGCSLAPFYHCYRNYFAHRDCRWVLADLANFPFHYAKYLYRHDADAEFLTIRPADFTDPLATLDTRFDVVIITTVFEHLDDPVFIAQYLLDRLKPGGLFVFDFIKSDGVGMDTPQAVAGRDECLSIIRARTSLVYGRVDASQSVMPTIVMKRI